VCYLANGQRVSAAFC